MRDRLLPLAVLAALDPGPPELGEPEDALSERRRAREKAEREERGPRALSAAEAKRRRRAERNRRLQET